MSASAAEPEQRNKIDHFSHFSGLAVAHFYLVCAVVTLYEVIARYAFDAPTQWAFEVVMVLCASAWMLSAGYVTLLRRHIGVTVFYALASPKAQRRLDLLAILVAITALTVLLSDALPFALRSIMGVERTGSGFNSPQPLILKSMLVFGIVVYLAQLLVQLYRYPSSPHWRSGVALLSALIVIYALALIAAMLFNGTPLAHTAAALADLIEYPLHILDPSQYINARSIGIGWVSLIIVVVLIALMATGMPLGIVTLIVSIACALVFFGPRGLYLVSSNAFGLLEKYPLIAVPLFVLMASILERAGIARDLFDSMSIVAGRLRGGVAVQTVIVAVILAAMSGVMGGEIVMLGLVALPQMLRLGYDRKLTIGLICASGALATLIPPSIIMIVYGLSADVAIGDLFLAGVVPGCILATFYASYVLIRCHINPSLAPTAAENAARGIITGNSGATLTSTRLIAVGLCIFLIFCVMGSIYAGIASVTEAAGVGVFGALIVALVRNRFSYRLLLEALAGTMSTVGTIIWLILGAVSFVGIYNLIGGGEFMRSLFADLGLPALGIIFVMMGILIVLGTFMEWIAIVFITVPVFAPVVVDMAPELGLAPEWAAIWFGVLFVMNIQIYFLSPPFGPACFWLKSVAPPDITLQEIFIAVLPFIALQVVGLFLVMFIPDIALWLPKTLGN